MCKGIGRPEIYGKKQKQHQQQQQNQEQPYQEQGNYEFYVVIHEKPVQQQHHQHQPPVKDADQEIKHPEPEEKKEDCFVDSVNLVTHMWKFSGFEFNEQLNIQLGIVAGVFAGHGIEFNNSGKEIEHANERDKLTHYWNSPIIATEEAHLIPVIIHDLRFSPNNAQIKLTPNQLFHSFYSVCCSEDRRILVFHIIPGVSQVHDILKKITQESETIPALLQNIAEQPNLAVLFHQLKNILQPLLV